MRIIEDDELIETMVDGATFLHTRLAVADHAKLLHEVEQRGLVQDMRLEPAVARLCLRAWRGVQGRGGREILSPRADDLSQEAQTQRAYVIEHFPYAHLSELVTKMTSPSVEEAEKNSEAPLSGASSLPTDAADANLGARTVEPNGLKTDSPSLATVAA